MEKNLIASVFDSQSKDWNAKKQFVTYHGAYSNIKNEVFANFDAFINYLKSIGTYQKVIGYYNNK